MRIVLATPLFPPEIAPLGTYTKALAAELASEYQVSVVAFAGEVEKVSGVTITTVSKRHSLPVRLALFAHTLWNATKRADLVYAQNAVAAGLPSLIVAKLRRIPVVVHFDEDEAWKTARRLHLTQKSESDYRKQPKGNFQTRNLSRIQRFVLRHADHVVIADGSDTESIRSYGRIAMERLAVIPMPARTPEVFPFTFTRVPYQIHSTIPDGNPTDASNLIDTLSLIVAKYPDTHLIVTGDGPIRTTLQVRAHDLKLEGHVTFLGIVSRAEDWYTKATSVASVQFATHGEVMHEVTDCFSAKTPIILWDKPLTDIFKDKENVLIVTDRAPESLADAIVSIMGNESLRNTLIADAENTLAEQCSSEAHKSTLLDLFRQITTKRP